MEGRKTMPQFPIRTQHLSFVIILPPFFHMKVPRGSNPSHAEPVNLHGSL